MRDVDTAEVAWHAFGRDAGECMRTRRKPRTPWKRSGWSRGKPKPAMFRSASVRSRRFFCCIDPGGGRGGGAQVHGGLEPPPLRNTHMAHTGGHDLFFMPPQGPQYKREHRHRMRNPLCHCMGREPQPKFQRVNRFLEGKSDGDMHRCGMEAFANEAVSCTLVRSSPDHFDRAELAHARVLCQPTHPRFMVLQYCLVKATPRPPNSVALRAATNIPCRTGIQAITNDSTSLAGSLGRLPRTNPSFHARVGPCVGQGLHGQGQPLPTQITKSVQSCICARAHVVNLGRTWGLPPHILLANPAIPNARIFQYDVASGPTSMSFARRPVSWCTCPRLVRRRVDLPYRPHADMHLGEFTGKVAMPGHRKMSSTYAYDSITKPGKHPAEACVTCKTERSRAKHPGLRAYKAGIGKLVSPIEPPRQRTSISGSLVWASTVA